MSLYPLDFRRSFRWPFRPKAQNDNDTLNFRAEWIVAACEFIRHRSEKLKQKALRLVK